MKARGNIKMCASCRTDKTLDDYQKNRHRPDGLHTDCRVCVSAANRLWREKNPDKKKATNARLAHQARLARYGLSESEFNEMVAAQRGGCAICSRVSTLAIDHCHKSGKVRGLLCSNCNTTLGLMADDAQRLRVAASYLEK